MADSIQDQLQSALGRAYIIDRELGGGGMSRVFLATETALGRQVVVKILREEIGAAISPERFGREVRLAASLQHPNIVSVLTAGSGGDAPPFYTMPFVRGRSLRERMTGGMLPLSEAVAFLRDVARALSFAHANGVVHRDIKPENVLISGDAALVTDFGIAKAISAATAANTPTAADASTLVTDLGMRLGTPAYMSPEQATGDNVGAPTDVYAWGVMAYEILTGGHPFPGATTQAKLLAAHLGETPAPLATRGRDLPRGLVALVTRCLAKDPTARPANGAEIVRELDAVLLSATARTASLPTGRRALAWGAATAVAIGLVLAFALTRHGSPSSPNGRSIAVMPFAVVGGDSANAYFAEGMASELTGALTKIPSLAVASQTSAFALGKRDNLGAREIGKLLHVGALLEGSVRRADNRLRVTTSLTRTTDGVTLWSDTYEGDAKDVFAVQDKITRAVVGALSVRLAGGAETAGKRSRDAGTTDADAYDLFLRGRYLLERRGAGVTRAADYFSQAVARDSNYARAYAALSEALDLFPYFAGVSTQSVEARATAAAERALALDSTLAEAHMALGMAQQLAYRWDAAGAEFRRAVALDSLSSSVRTQYGRHLMYRSKLPEALVQFRRAERLDPSDGTPQVWTAFLLSVLGHHDAAMTQARRAWETDSLLFTARTVLAEVPLDAGRNAEALDMVENGGRMPLPFNGLAAYVMYRAGRRPAADSIVAALRALPSDTWMVHSSLAYAYLGAPDTTRALDELERALHAREIVYCWQPYFDPIFDVVRHSARFAALVRASGLDASLLAEGNGGRPL